MNKKNIIPQTSKPVMRLSCGTQTDLFTELSEEVLSGTVGVTSQMWLATRSLPPQYFWSGTCSMDDDAE